MSSISFLIFLFLLSILIFVKYRVKNSEEFRKKVIVKLKKLSLVFFMPYWALIISSLLVFYTYGRIVRPSIEISSSLKNNLQNLNGLWGFYNEKEREHWSLQISYDLNTKKGNYVLSHKYDSWGENTKNEVKKVSEGSFVLVEGYDRYGDKAFVGRNTATNNPVFIITQLENNLADDWLLRISMIEDQMLGEHMIKL